MHKIGKKPNEVVRRSQIQDFGNSRKEFFSKYLDLKNGIPSHDTFNRFFSLYEPKSFQNIFVEWLSTLINIKEKHIAIDGKSCRGSHSKTGEMLHLLHAYTKMNYIIDQ